MDFSINDEQRMLADTVGRVARERYSFDARKRFAREAKGYDAEIWALAAELGLLAVPFAEEDGGVGGGGVELMLLHEAFGRALMLEPFLAAVVLGGGLVARLGAPAQRENILPGVMAGETTLALAYAEPAGRYDPFLVETRAERDGAGWRLTGEKAVVLNGDTADKLIVTARTSGAPGERRGVSAFVVDGAQSGVTRKTFATIDGLRGAEIRLDNVAVADGDLLGPEGGAPTRWRRRSPPAASRFARRPSARWRAPATSPLTTSRRARSSARRSVGIRFCSTAWSTCASRWSRPAPWPSSPHAACRRPLPNASVASPPPRR